MEEAQNKTSKKAFLFATPTRDPSPTLAQRSSPQSLHAKPTFSRVCFAVPRTRPISTRFRALLASLDAASRRNNTRRAPKAPRRHREQAARDESPSAASRLRDVRHVLGRVRRATGVAPGRPQLPQGVGAPGARAAARRRAARAGRRPPTGYPNARAVWRAPPGLPRAPNGGATRERRRPGLRRPPRGAAPRRERLRAPRRRRLARRARQRRLGQPVAGARARHARRDDATVYDDVHVRPPRRPRTPRTVSSSAPTASTSSSRDSQASAGPWRAPCGPDTMRTHAPSRHRPTTDRAPSSPRLRGGELRQHTSLLGLITVATPSREHLIIT